ncbi:hypothetical protein [Spiroplasma endosymbiont of Nebria brevicollis]|uniref:hypothetical protein n=1 Tax=Spiroplasma endosymbiont of Nebria brevicollis TaxID=3066284 RepID=UPI00313DCC4A
MCDYLNDEAQVGNDSIKRKFFPLIVVRSNYGRSFWLKGSGRKDDFFAEAFDQWLDTPKNDRTWNWQLLNDFFTKKLPSYF